ncbi:hypothetical protein URH17368_2909 [Alicyclobacillus hesperidum URH17-3-68]|uniref:hypothetical protein n=1 Tax=Alicyclobacillus hesperidum TaxID=89784 RepID=UPI000281C20D|nr:hypothetical protein [Alicyclobacillus hesperidum]EJY54441.1 hypothetical protein URH17368_2909 [Alicyclobacillus hesperidum URH17-3-68]
MRDAIPTKKRLSATVYYLLTGLCLGWPSLASLGVLLPDWRRGEVIFPLSLAAIHLFILGSMLTVAFGVLFQVIPIAFQAPPIPRHVLCWHLPIHVASVASMTAGFITSSFTIVAVGGAVLFANTTLYFAFIGHHYVRARNKTLVHRILSLPVSVLWFVMLLGLFQATFPNKVFPGVLLTHIILGGLAFWGGLVMVLSYKLVPMFVISHGCRVSLAGTASFYYSGVLLWIVSTWYSVGNTAYVLRDVGTAALLIGLICYTRDMLRIVIARKKRRIAFPIYEALAAMALCIVGELGIAMSTLVSLHSLLFVSIYVFGFGGLVALMYAYMQKIVPFLWFEYRFSKRPERKTAPLIDDMVPRRTALTSMLFYFGGTIVGAIALTVGKGSMVSLASWVSDLAMTGGSMLLFLSLRHVLTIGGKRPDDHL